MALRPRAAVLAAVLLAVAAASDSEAVVGAALAADDQCAAEDKDCALSALQLRAREHSSAARRQCATDTGGSCWFLPCAKSHGPTVCVDRSCICKPGYCNNRGTCVKETLGPGGAEESGYGLKPLCNADTGGTCMLFRCSGWHGSTKCQDRHCMCQAGECSADGVCHPDMGTFTAGVAPVRHPGDPFPPRHNQITTALCLSGGGTRAQSNGLGVLRALEHLGLMGGVDAISSVSGGTWAASQYVFAAMDAKAALGAPTAPAELTMDALKQQPPPLLATAANHMTPVVLKYITEGLHMSPELWPMAVAATFLKPLGLDERNSYMAPDQATVERIKKQNPQLKDSVFYVPQRNQTLIMSGTLLAPAGYEASSENAVSLQMSPDYAGSPFFPNGDTVSYAPDNGDKSEALDSKVVGGGFVETFAFGGLAPPQGQKTAGQAQWGAPIGALSLAKAISISSAGPAAALTEVGGTTGSVELAKLNPRSNYWPILGEATTKFEGPQGAMSYQLGDGGNIDDTGVLAALQRRAKRVISIISTYNPIPAVQTADFCHMQTTPPDYEALGHVDGQTAALFGLMQKNSIGEFETRNQVFKQAELPKLMCELQTLKGQGKPAVAVKHLEVLKNDWWGIEPATEVGVLFVYLNQCTGFEGKLPAETQAELRDGEMGALARFPHYRTVLQNPPEATGLTVPQANLLAAQGEYFIMQNEALVRQFLQT